MTFEFILERGYGTPPIWHQGPAEAPNVRARTKKLWPPWSQTCTDLPKASRTCTPKTAPLPTWAALSPSPTALQCAAGITPNAAGGRGTLHIAAGSSSNGNRNLNLAKCACILRYILSIGKKMGGGKSRQHFECSCVIRHRSKWQVNGPVLARIIPVGGLQAAKQQCISY